MLYPSGTPQNPSFEFYGDFNPYGLRLFTGEFGNNLQQQFNVTENLARVIGAHQIKLGFDFRRIHPEPVLEPYQLQYLYSSLSSVLNNNGAQAYVVAYSAGVELNFSNWSLFSQDTWKPAHIVTVTYGLRWEYNTAPSSPNGTLPFTVTQVNNFATMTLAPQGTPLWHPQKDNFAPRLGVAWQVRPNLVMRSGAGIFYDLGYSSISNGVTAWPYAQQKLILNTSFPLSPADAAPPPFTTTSPAGALFVVNPNHVLPRTYEWNASVERRFGNSDALSLTYLGAAGRKLMRADYYYKPNANFSSAFSLFSNGANSSYQALQSQFRHGFQYGLQALLSYNWGHSIDDVSSDAYIANVPPGASALSNRGSSNYDTRQTFSGAISYDIPAPGIGIWKSIFGSWSTDSIIYARSTPPVNVVTGQNTFGLYLSAATSVQRPNLVPGVPLWISDPNVAGAKRINPAAFSKPGLQGDLGRNTLRGFGATEVDLTLRRQFKLYERLSLQARADLFNIFNHPNFGPPTNYMTSPLFGQATQMLGASLGAGGQTGGLNPLYQIGGPRSAQLALKLVF